MSLLLGQSMVLQPWWRGDDGLYLRQAVNILNGTWLGSYDELTLAKAPGFPLFLAANFLSGIPLHLTQGLLYTLGALLFCLALRPVIKRPWILLLLFAIIQFEPIGLLPMRVLREPLYSSLTLMTLAGALALSLRVDHVEKPIGQWALLYGSSLGLFWITREEGLWLVPALVLPALLLVFKAIRRSSDRQIRRRVVLSLFGPPLIAGTIVGSVALCNFFVYGVFLINDQGAGPFPRAMEGLQSLLHPDVLPRVHLPKTARRQVYDLSPRFRELEPYLETPGWYRAGCRRDGFPCDDVNAGWLPWAIRHAAADAGHHRSARDAHNFFLALNADVEHACAEGRLTCGPRGFGLMPPLAKWDWSHAVTALRKFPNLMIKYRCCAMSKRKGKRFNTSGGLEAVSAMAQVTNLPGEILSVLDKPVVLKYTARLSLMKTHVRKRILDIYRVLTPTLFGLTAAAFIWIMVRLCRRRMDPADWSCLFIMAVLAAGTLSRMAILLAVELSAFYAINPGRIQISQPLFLALGVVGLAWVLEQVMRLRDPSRHV